MYSEFSDIRTDVEPFDARPEITGGYPVIWIRAGENSVSFTFNRTDRAKLRAALDAADAIADKLLANAQELLTRPH